MNDHLLPWERPAGEPSGVGICLSGGGLRAAGFSLGAIQALQEELGLLYGPNAADHLAVVSGGSYMGGAFSLTAVASDSPVDPPPLSGGAPETDHILSHGRYLVEDGTLRTIGRFLPRVIANVIAGAGLFLWTAVMLADVAALCSRLMFLPLWQEPWRLGALVVFFLAVGALAMSTIADRLFRAYLWIGLGGLSLLLSIRSAVAEVLGRAALSSPRWWLTHRSLIVVAFGVFLSATGVSGIAALGRRPPALLRLASDAIARTAPKVVGGLLTCFVLAAVQPWMVAALDERLSNKDATWLTAFFFGALFAGLLATYVPDVVSLHRPYRDLLARCFGVRRASATTVELIEPTTAAAVSNLDPHRGDPQRAFPRLLVCATANVRQRRAGTWRRSNVSSFVFSHDRSGLTEAPGASFSTEKLELGRARAGVTWKKKEPELSLLGAIGMTGAALAPSMGSMTLIGLRPVLALFNLRLGVWLPNPLSAVRRDVVEARPGRPPLWSSRRKEYGGLGPGFEALVAEFFGLHTKDARRVLVTDGGHYDNLGLLALLRARCETIWCVDAYHHPHHLGRQLEHVIALARSELGVEIDIDLKRFDLMQGSDDVATHDYASGEIKYRDTARSGTLIVVKLAFTPDTPSTLQDYRTIDRKFPYHPTWVQWFDKTRFERYRQLGHHVASGAIDERRRWRSHS